MLKVAVFVFLFLFAAIQLRTIERVNPPVSSDLPASGEVKTMLKRACYDCHSNETSWPWYSYVAPVSWLMAEHVYQGREALNFSVWNSYSRGAQARHISDSILAMEQGTMPTWDYVLTHPDAAVSAADVVDFKAWAADYFK